MTRARCYVLSLAAILPAFSPLEAMTVNLAGPYQSLPCPPRARDLAFYAPGHDDFLFSGPSSPCVVCLSYQRALTLEWTLSRDRVNTPFLTGTVAPRFDNSFKIEVPTEKLEPGFFELKVTVKLSDGEKLQGQTAFGWRFTEMSIHPLRPKDFAEFWKEALTKIDLIPPTPHFALEKTLHDQELGNYNVTSACLPENYDPPGERYHAIEVYRVRFASWNHQTIEGWFAKPVGPGPFPGLLVLPGAGNNPRPAPVEHARHGYAALDIQVHGNPVDAREYQPVADDSKAAHPEEKTHFGIYLHALQGARALKLLPGVDPNRLAVLGGSQGGRLTMVVAALDPSFKAAIPAITHFCYMPWLRWTGHLNTEGQSGDGGFIPAKDPDASLMIESYFDVLNFAPSVRCPVLMNAGLIDWVSPPTGVFAAYRALPGEKEIVPLPNTGHDWSPAFDRYAWRWLEKILARPSSPHEN